MVLNRGVLIQQAQEVLQRNWLGYATKPAPRLYPHQWSWDAAFIAMAYAHYDPPRAMQEMRSLFSGQWKNGLLPHIIFTPQVVDYYPGPELWQTDRSPFAPRQVQTSGIVQPPLHATAIWHIARHDPDQGRARAFLEEMYPSLAAWHAYLYRERDPEGEGLVSIRHPWESGQDNSPIWDRALARFEVRKASLPAYRRVDTLLVDPAARPSNAEYDRYAYLVKLFRDQNYDEDCIREVSPFLIQDVLFNTLLIQANHDLSAIASSLGEDPTPFDRWARQTTQGMNSKLWDPEHAIYFDYDLINRQPVHAHVAAGFSPLFAGVPNVEQANQILAGLNSHGFCRINETCWAVPSFDREEPGYSPNRYWRGPIWINLNWMLYWGLRCYGFQEYADRVKNSIIELPRRYGFYEYFDPDTGRGHGSDDFSWTAALLIDLVLEEEIND